MSKSVQRAGIAAATTAAAGLTVWAFLSIRVLRDGAAALVHLNWAWLPLALVAESGSMAAFARSQRQLLQADGSTLSIGSALAVTYAANAVASTVPIAGTGFGTAFSFRQFRRKGLDTAAVGWALTISGVVSSLAFALVIAVGAALSNDTAASTVGFTTAVANALPVVTILLALRAPSVRSGVNRLVGALVSLSRLLFRRPRAEAASAFENLLTRAASMNATPRQYALAFVEAVRNWTADCLCLGFAIAASGGPVPWRGLLLAYCLAKAVAGFGITPGGVGVVEVTLSAALVRAGMPVRHALPAVLLYRLISYWLVAVVGWVVLAALSRKGPADGGVGASAPAEVMK
jgi:uncharacterized protein (TIRG00374 family)